MMGSYNVCEGAHTPLSSTKKLKRRGCPLLVYHSLRHPLQNPGGKRESVMREQIID